MKRCLTLVAACSAFLHPIAANFAQHRATGQARAVDVSIVQDAQPGPATNHGLGKLKAALAVKGLRYEEVNTPESAHGRIIIDSGLSAGPVGARIRELGVAIADKPESLVIHKLMRNGTQTLLLSGSDDRGLMYALLESAKRIGWASDKSLPLSEIRDTVESPDVADRDVIMFTMQKHQYEDRLHDAKYWDDYFDLMADSRLNDIQVLFAYEANGYNCPVYPYYMDVAGFPKVKVVGLSEQEQQQNLADLHRLVRSAHDHGVRVTFGIWCHYYRFNPWVAQWEPVDPTNPPPYTVTGVTEANLIPFTLTAIKQFLTEFREIDGVQLLMMDESGLKTEQMKDFWRNIYPALKEGAPNLQYEIRAKGVSDDLIKQGMDLGLHIRVNTKFWNEQVGLPFFPTHVQVLDQFNRRGGYSDMLRYPRNYKLHWTLWTGGTNRVLLWGDPDYVRRFATVTHLGGAEGFDIDEPLATKMAGHSHDLKPFNLLSPEYRYYDYEFQRYWYEFQLYGRLTYNPNTPLDEWDHEFNARFGKEAAPYIRQGLKRASQILPEITAYNLSAAHYPTTEGWPERQRGGDLPDYVKATPSDVEQFESLPDAADDILNGRSSAKMTPKEVGEWFDRASHDVRELVAKAEASAGAQPGKEFVSTTIDLKILAGLADYHSQRVRAGLSYALFEKTGDLNSLDDAIAQEQKAIADWAGMVRDAGNVYTFDLMMGVASRDLGGHWRDELVKLNAGLAALKKQRESFQPQLPRVMGKFDLSSGPVQQGYQRLSESKIATQTTRSGSLLVTFNVPDGRYQIDVGIHDDKASHGPMWIEVNGIEYSKPFQVPAGEAVQRTMEGAAINGALKVLFDHATSVDAYVSTIVLTRVNPSIAHVPVQRLTPGQDLKLRATVAGTAPIEKVVVHFGDEQHGFVAVEMHGAGALYEATIPAARLGSSTSYFLEAIDAAGRASTYPERGSSGPLTVLVSSDHEPPTLRHSPPSSAIDAQRPLHIIAQVADPSGVKWVHLRYRGLSQHQDYRELTMVPTGKENEYEATIPGADISPSFDLMYFFEAMDNEGNGRIYPDMEKETPYVVVQVKQDQHGGLD